VGQGAETQGTETERRQCRWMVRLKKGREGGEATRNIWLIFGGKNFKKIQSCPFCSV